MVQEWASDSTGAMTGVPQPAAFRAFRPQILTFQPGDNGSAATRQSLSIIIPPQAERDMRFGAIATGGHAHLIGGIKTSFSAPSTSMGVTAYDTRHQGRSNGDMSPDRPVGFGLAQVVVTLQALQFNGLMETGRVAGFPSAADPPMMRLRSPIRLGRRLARRPN